MNSIGRIGSKLERQSIAHLRCFSNSVARWDPCTPAGQFRSASSSSSSSTSSPGAGPSGPPRSRKAIYLLAIPLAFLPFGLFGKSRKPIDPYVYSDHKVGSSTRLTPQHALLAIPLSTSDAATFKSPRSDNGDGTEDGSVVIQHLMVKNPDIQIERPYTPINDVGKDGEVRMVVKRVKGGEVGRWVHSIVIQ